MKESAQQRALRERFCCFYLLLGNGEEAAIQAGLPAEQAADYAAAQLQTALCRRTLQRLSAQPALSVRTLVMTGLTRLAFGKANDAAKLVFAEDMPSPEMLEQLDLFHVSEVKRIKGGGVEVRLFDRQKAMERLLDCANEVDSTATANALLAAFTAPEEVHGCESDTDPETLFAQTAEGSALVDGRGLPTL